MNGRVAHLTRRSALFLGIGGAVLTFARAGRTTTSEPTGSVALAFDGEALIVAGVQVWRRELSGGAADILSTPRAPVRALACHPGRPGRLLAA
ncbi:MAG: hypothetical protein AAF762_02035, partial [Pseudomonadota bacterium]